MATKLIFGTVKVEFDPETDHRDTISANLRNQVAHMVQDMIAELREVFDGEDM